MKQTDSVDAKIVGLAARLRERLAEYYLNPKAENCQLQVVRVRSAAYSRLFVFHGLSQDGALNIRLAVKVYSGVGQLAFAQRQFDALNLLWGDFSKSPRLKIPKPLDFLPDLPAIVMEEVAGCSVQELVKWASWLRWTREKALTACRNCGEWLHHFHSVTRVSQGQLDAREKQQSLHLGVARLATFGFDAETCKHLEEKIELLVNILSEQNEQRSLVHGDFTVDNVLLDGDITTVLDVEGRYQNLIYHDMASFLNSIALVGLGLPMRESVIRLCSEAFLLGYLGDRKCNNSALWFLRVSGLVSVALEVLGRYASQPLARIWLQRGFGQLFDRLALEAPV
jgi:phosphotransferase family enzyme